MLDSKCSKDIKLQMLLKPVVPAPDPIPSPFVLEVPIQMCPYSQHA